LRLRNEGHFAQGGRGELYLYIDVRRHHLFERSGDTIRYRIKVSALHAILGTDLDISTLNGNVKMKIPAGTQPNTVFRLKGKGIANIHTKRVGDQLVEVEVEIPRKLSSKEKRLVEDWAKLRRES